MLTICVGPNGSGKSLWALHQIIRLLRTDSRLIVTSLAVDLGRLNEYLQGKDGEDAPDVFNRVLRIDAEQMRFFWRYRGMRRCWTDGQDVEGEASEAVHYGPFVSSKEQSRDERWAHVDKGVIFVLDEAQTVFGARDWQQTGPEFVAYQSQHRKFGDDVIAISPASALLDKQFRILAGECVALTNLYKLSIGPVKAPRKISYRVFQNCPPAPGETPLTQGSFKIDGKGLASCYNTAAGLGIAGLDADKGKEAKGVPFYWIFVVLALVVVVSWLGLRRVTAWAVARGSEKARLTATAAASAPVVPQRSAEVAQGEGPRAGVMAQVAEVPVVRMSGIVVNGSRWHVFLSDGRSYHSGDNRVAWVTRDACEVEGKVYRLSNPAPGSRVDERRLF